MGKSFFITGTDTNIGKTYITVGLLKLFNSLNMQTIGLKPIATGCATNNHGYNNDALLLQRFATINLTYNQVNPFALTMATSPNIAAQNLSLSATMITAKLELLNTMSFDVALIEGVGGWHAPINPHETMADVVKALACPVILVIGLRLGCLNHAILTYKSIMANDLSCIGWIGNCIDPTMEYTAQNIATLKQFLPAPHLGTVRFNEKPEDVLDIKPLLP